MHQGEGVWVGALHLCRPALICAARRFDLSLRVPRSPLRTPSFTYGGRTRDRQTCGHEPRAHALVRAPLRVAVGQGRFGGHRLTSRH